MRQTRKIGKKNVAGTEKKYLKKNRETTSWWRHWALKQNQFSPDHPSLYFFLFFCENIFCPLDKSFQLWRKGTTKDCDQLKYLPTLFFSKDTTRYKHHAITEAYASEGPRHLWNNIQLFVQKTKLASHAPFYNFFFFFFTHWLKNRNQSKGKFCCLTPRYLRIICFFSSLSSSRLRRHPPVFILIILRSLKLRLIRFCVSLSKQNN